MHRSSIVLVLLAGLQLCANNAAAEVDCEVNASHVRISNGRIELTVDIENGLNPVLLRDRYTGRKYADTMYVWPGGIAPKLARGPRVTRRPDGGCIVEFEARVGNIAIRQVFSTQPEIPDGIIEMITLRNDGKSPIDNSKFACGFAKVVRKGDIWLRDASALKVCVVPYRRDTDGQTKEYPLKEVAQHGSGYTGWFEPFHQTATWGSDAWTLGDGKATLLTSKYNRDNMEWSLLEPSVRDGQMVVRFAGAGIWKHGSPERGACLEPGESFTFGKTLLRIVEGDWKQAYYAHRDFTELQGCITPHNYNPPVHWNELYENECFSALCGIIDSDPDFLRKIPDLLKRLYTLEMMKAQAAKAKELGCEALYLDPGWDTGPSHHVWGDDRLGCAESFLDTMRKEYGLGVSIWIGLAGAPPTYADPTVLPVEARRMDADGKRSDVLCVASPAFIETKKRLLGKLARKGFAFMMFDSTQYTGPCYDPTHGHSIPSTREEHARAVMEIIASVKKVRPDILIELHDPITGPSGTHYTPTYYYYAQPYSFDCLWGHEFMWQSMDDLLSGRAISLYYYNLAYSIPLYLHIGLKNDNRNALAFWWYASTCRHLGVGGQSDDPEVWTAHKLAMKTYLSLKRFYTQGVFYGLDETIHVHSLPDKKACVINVFNVTDKDMDREIAFSLSEVGLPAGAVIVDGMPAATRGDEVACQVHVPAKGQCLVRISVK